MPCFNRWGNFQPVQLQWAPGDWRKSPLCSIACRFPSAPEFKNSLINLSTCLCYLYFTLCVTNLVVQVRQLQGITNTETEFHGTGEGQTCQVLCFKKCDTSSCTWKHAPGTLWLMITLYISPATVMAGVNTIQVSCSQSAVSTSKAFVSKTPKNRELE